MKASKANRQNSSTRPAPITFTGRLLTLQSLALVALAILAAPEPPIANHEWRELWRAGLYMTLAFISAWSGLGLLRLRPPAWNLAMLVQGTSLLHVLVLYRAGERPFYIYLQMLLAILIVVNLNQSALRASFPTEIITEAQDTP
ncbi:MAG: hypothetical protein KIS88_10700 [Anaerolineales bacterium]|nr:hypothetical protein [Anaerolineales bacterium]